MPTAIRGLVLDMPNKIIRLKNNQLPGYVDLTNLLFIGLIVASLFVDSHIRPTLLIAGLMLLRNSRGVKKT